MLAHCLTLALAATACNSDGRTLRPAGPDQTASVYTTTTSSTVVETTVLGAAIAEDPALDVPELAFVLNLPWEEGGAIDPRYTCDGADIQPGFSWLGAPANAVEMALVVVDIDADNFVHWVIAGLDPTNPFVGENDVPISAIEGTNGFAVEPAAPPTTVVGASVELTESGLGWRGPCPPAGTMHRYRFTLYALAEHIELPTGSSAADLQAAIDATSLTVAQRTGVYPGT